MDYDRILGVLTILSFCIYPTTPLFAIFSVGSVNECATFRLLPRGRARRNRASLIDSLEFAIAG